MSTVAPALEVDEAGRRVSVGGRDLALTRTEFAIVALLHRNRGTALTRAAIIAEVWARSPFDDGHALEVHVSRIRRKLATAGLAEDPLRAVRGIGYRYDAPVHAPLPVPVVVGGDVEVLHAPAGHLTGSEEVHRPATLVLIRADGVIAAVIADPAGVLPGDPGSLIGAHIDDLFPGTALPRLSIRLHPVTTPEGHLFGVMAEVRRAGPAVAAPIRSTAHRP